MTTNTTNCQNLNSQDFRINKIMQKYPHSILKILLILGILVQTMALTACEKNGKLSKATFKGDWVKHANGSKTPCNFGL